MSQTINLRVNSIQDDNEQVFCTLLMSGIPVGHMAFTVGEYQIFAAALLIGIKKTGGRLIDISQDEVFRKWAERDEAEK